LFARLLTLSFVPESPPVCTRLTCVLLTTSAHAHFWLRSTVIIHTCVCIYCLLLFLLTSSRVVRIAHQAFSFAHCVHTEEECQSMSARIVIRTSPACHSSMHASRSCIYVTTIRHESLFPFPNESLVPT
jgi:hypothetical protein